jgi:hypothetical protein
MSDDVALCPMERLALSARYKCSAGRHLKPSGKVLTKGEFVTPETLMAIPTLAEAPVQVDPRLLHLKYMVIDGVTAANSKRNYAQALDHLFTFAVGLPINRELPLGWCVAMKMQPPSTVNIRLSAMRRLIAEAKSAQMLSSEEAETLSAIPNIMQAGIRRGAWLTREQAKEILAFLIVRSLR